MNEQKSLRVLPWVTTKASQQEIEQLYVISKEVREFNPISEKDFNSLLVSHRLKAIEYLSKLIAIMTNPNTMREKWVSCQTGKNQLLISYSDTELSNEYTSYFSYSQVLIHVCKINIKSTHRQSNDT